MKILTKLEPHKPETCGLCNQPKGIDAVFHPDAPITADLSQFGWKELREARELLLQFESKRPYWLAAPRLVFNKMSGKVMLLDDEHSIGMLDEDGNLAVWHTCPNCGEEGFASLFDEQAEAGTINDCCLEYIQRYGTEII